MKFVIDIPDAIVSAYRENHGISRRALKREFNITEQTARQYLTVLHNGQIIHTEQVKLMAQSGRIRRAGVLPDLHFPYHDQRALDAATEWCLHRGVDTIIIQGDGVDCYDVSYWKKDPLRKKFPAERMECKALIERFTKAFDASVDKIWLEGNHEDRLRRWVWEHAPQFADMDELTIPHLYGLKDLGWKYVSNTQLKRQGAKPLRIGKLWIFHGHEIGISRGAVNFARLHYLKDPIVQTNAHHHVMQEDSITKSDGQADASWTNGCLCDLAPEYAPFNKWCHGFQYVEWDAEGMFRLENHKIIDGKVY